MIYFAIFIFAFTLLRLLVLLSNLVFKPWLKESRETPETKVSVLIPARDEEENIGQLLDQLIHAEPRGLIHEIIVYNDQSKDETAHIVDGYSIQDQRVRLISGSDLPEGWLGKNYACSQLSHSASGDWFLFLDADVRLSQSAVAEAIAMAESKRLSLLSVFPHQVMHTRGEWLVVPIMNWILLTLLPLVLVRTCRWTSFSAANGQFMLFRSTVYQRHQWHEQVKKDPVEDILISRKIKKAKYRMATLIGRGEISCRMYSGYQEALNGFTKNFGQFFGNSRLWMIIFGALTSAGLLVIPIGLSWYWTAGYLLLLLLMRVFIARITQVSLQKTLLYAIRHQLVLMVLIFRSLAYRRGRKLIWKGRSI